VEYQIEVLYDVKVHYLNCVDFEECSRVINIKLGSNQDQLTYKMKSYTIN